MEKTAKTSNTRNMHAIILGVLGIILVIVGGTIVTVRGMPFRGSGLGTISILVGFVLLAIAFLRFYYKAPH